MSRSCWGDLSPTLPVIIVTSTCTHLHDKQLTIFLFLSRYGKGDFVRGTVLIFLPGLPEIMELEESRLMTEFIVELGYTRDICSVTFSISLAAKM